jgi:hypothetical protein
MNEFFARRFTVLFFLAVSVLLTTQSATAQMSAAEYKAISREIGKYGYALVSASVKVLRASAEVDARRIELYNIDLNNMNAVQDIPLIWPTNLGTAPNSIIGIIDTGVEKSHELLAGKVISEACFSSSFPGLIDSLCPSGVHALVGNNAGLPCSDAVTC